MLSGPQTCVMHCFAVGVWLPALAEGQSRLKQGVFARRCKKSFDCALRFLQFFSGTDHLFTENHPGIFPTNTSHLSSPDLTSNLPPPWQTVPVVPRNLPRSREWSTGLLKNGRLKPNQGEVERKKRGSIQTTRSFLPQEEQLWSQAPADRLTFCRLHGSPLWAAAFPRSLPLSGPFLRFAFELDMRATRPRPVVGWQKTTPRVIWGPRLRTPRPHPPSLREGGGGGRIVLTSEGATGPCALWPRRSGEPEKPRSAISQMLLFPENAMPDGNGNDEICCHLQMMQSPDDAV